MIYTCTLNRCVLLMKIKTDLKTATKERYLLSATTEKKRMPKSLKRRAKPVSGFVNNETSCKELEFSIAALSATLRALTERSRTSCAPKNQSNLHSISLIYATKFTPCNKMMAIYCISRLEDFTIVY